MKTKFEKKLAKFGNWKRTWPILGVFREPIKPKLYIKMALVLYHHTWQFWSKCQEIKTYNSWRFLQSVKASYIRPQFLLKHQLYMPVSSKVYFLAVKRLIITLLLLHVNKLITNIHLGKVRWEIYFSDLYVFSTFYLEFGGHFSKQLWCTWSITKARTTTFFQKKN